MSDLWIWQHPEWPKFHWDQAKVSNPLAQARLAQGKTIGVAEWLSADLRLDAVAKLLMENGLTTSAIEGEILDAKEVRSSVARHLGLSTEGLPTPKRATDGLIEVLIDATHHYSHPLTKERLVSWQAALFPTGYSGLHPILTGTLRGNEPMHVVSGGIGREKIHFTAPPRGQLEAELVNFLHWFNGPSASLDGLLRAGMAHLWFVTLHPFEDGNGRLARAITDMALCQDEQSNIRLFSLSSQLLEHREQYYDLLEATQRGDLNITTWLCWFLNQTENSAKAAQQTVSIVLDKARFWIQHPPTELNTRQLKVLNRLLDAGKEGFEGGINTRKYASMTRVSRVTAYRELAELVAKGYLVATGKGGRSSGYAILW